MSHAELLLDTSAAVPYLLADSESHARITRRVAGLSLGLAGHAEFETFSVLTRLPPDVRVTPRLALSAIRRSFPATHYLDRSASAAATERLATLGIAGGAIWDGLVALAAVDAGLPLLTRDRRAVPTYALVGVRFELI